MGLKIRSKEHQFLFIKEEITMAEIEQYRSRGKKLYRIRVYLGRDVMGKKITARKSGFKTKKEAELAERQMILDYANGVGEYASRQAGIQTFQQLYDVWLNQYKLTVKESTFADTKRVYHRYIQKPFANRRLTKITPAFCQKWTNDIYKNYRSAHRIKNLVAQIINYGVRIDALPSNPFNKIIVPKVKEPLHDNANNFYTKEELNHFFSCLEEIGDPRYICAFRLLAFSGLRRGELIALKWKDVDFKNNKLKIRRAFYYNDLDKYIIEGTPKTKSSIRTLDLDKRTIQILQHWKLEQAKKFLAVGINTNDEEQRLFTTFPKNEDLIPNRVNDWLKWVYKKYPQKKITVHGFRHTHASLLFEAGATLKEVQTRLGHSSSKTTLDIYTHVTQSKKQEVAQKFANYIDF